MIDNGCVVAYEVCDTVFFVANEADGDDLHAEKIMQEEKDTPASML